MPPLSSRLSSSSSRQTVPKFPDCRIRRRTTKRVSSILHVTAVTFAAATWVCCNATAFISTKSVTRIPFGTLHPFMEHSMTANIPRPFITRLFASNPPDSEQDEWRAVLAAFKLYKAAYGDLRIPTRFVVPSMAPWPGKNKTLLFINHVSRLISISSFLLVNFYFWLIP